jgi:DNA mismatch repair protein MutL
VDAQPLGPGTLAVHSFPTFLFDRGVNPGAFLSELLERAEAEGWGVRGGQEAPETLLHEALDMMACKAAVRAGDSLAEEDMRELVALRERIERSSNCPHGRPTTVRLTIKELERLFGRS